MLGVILAPYGSDSPYGWYSEVAQARGGKWGQYLPQPQGYPRIDRQFNTRGEVGFYYDTRLGAVVAAKPPGPIKKLWAKITGKDAEPTPVAVVAPPTALPAGDGMTPTDAEMSKSYSCYTPVHSGWINAKQGFVPGTWRFNWNPAGPYGPQTSLSGLGQFPWGGIGETAPPQASATDVFNSMNMHNRRMFTLAIISTSAVSISALISLGLRYRRLKHEMSRKGRR